MARTQYQRSQETQRKLIDAVIQLAREKRYEAVTVKEICAAAGVSTGSFYHQFGSKDDLVLATYQKVDWLLTESFLQSCRDLPPAQALDRLLRRYVSFVRDDVGLVLAQYYRVRLNHFGPAFQHDADRPYFREMRRILREAADQGLLLSPLDPVPLAELLICLIRGLFVDWLIQSGRYDLMERYEVQILPLLGTMVSDEVQ